MIKKATLFIALLASVFLFAQKEDDSFFIDWGKGFKTDHKSSTAKNIIGQDDDYTYILRYSKKGNKVDKVDRDMNLVSSTELTLSYKKIDMDFEDIFMFNERFFLLASVKDTKKKEKRLYVQELDNVNFSSDKEPRKIGVLNFENGSSRRSGEFGFKVSEDKSKLLVFVHLPEMKKGRDQFNVHVLDDQLNELWSRNIQLPYEDNLFVVTHYNIDNNGNIYVLGKHYKDKAIDKRKGKPNYSYRLLTYQKEKEERDEYLVSLPGVFLLEMSIVPLENGNYKCVGFYSEESSVNVKGCYVLNINGKTGEIKNSNTFEFDMDFITQNMTEKEVKKTHKKAKKGKDVELYNYEIKDIVTREDGSFYMIGEQSYDYVVTTTTTNANGGVTYHTTHYFINNDIFVINVSKFDEIIWAQKIPKRQVTTNDGGFFSSYYLQYYKNKLYFFFNDNKDNLHVVISGKGANFNKSKKSSISVCVSMDEEGDQQKTYLFSYKQTEVLLKPRVCAKLDADQILFFAQKKKNQHYAKLVIQ